MARYEEARHMGGPATGKLEARCDLGARPRAGGEGGIRTLEGVTPLTVFETARFSRSRTSPPPFLHELTGFAQGGRRALAKGRATEWRS